MRSLKRMKTSSKTLVTMMTWPVLLRIWFWSSRPWHPSKSRKSLMICLTLILAKNSQTEWMTCKDISWSMRYSHREMIMKLVRRAWNCSTSFRDSLVMMSRMSEWVWFWLSSCTIMNMLNASIISQYFIENTLSEVYTYIPNSFFKPPLIHWSNPPSKQYRSKPKLTRQKCPFYKSANQPPTCMQLPTNQHVQNKTQLQPADKKTQISTVPSINSP